MVYDVAVPALGGAILRVFDHDPSLHAAVRAGRRRQRSAGTRGTCIVFKHEGRNPAG